MVTRSSRPRSRIRASTKLFCSAAIVIPVTCAPKCSAACSDSEPQPQPTSSRVVPGSRPACGRPATACRTGPARPNVRRGVIAARVGHLRVEDQLVELIAQVVVERDGAAVAEPAVQPAAEPGLRAGAAGGRPRAPVATAVRTARARRHRRPRPGAAPAPSPPRTRGSGRGRGRRDVELAGHVGLRGAELARSPQQPAYGVDGVEDDERARRQARPSSRPRPAAAPAGRR